MRVSYLRKILPDDQPPHLHLVPENDRDRRTCERLFLFGVTCGFGRDPDSGEIVHIQVEVGSNGK